MAALVKILWIPANYAEKNLYIFTKEINERNEDETLKERPKDRGSNPKLVIADSVRWDFVLGYIKN